MDFSACLSPSRGQLITAKLSGHTVDDVMRNELENLKWCARCREWQPVSQFGVDTARRDGRYPTCKTCRCLGHQEYRSRRAAKDIAANTVMLYLVRKIDKLPPGLRAMVRNWSEL